MLCRLDIGNHSGRLNKVIKNIEKPSGQAKREKNIVA